MKPTRELPDLDDPEVRKTLGLPAESREWLKFLEEAHRRAKAGVERSDLAASDSRLQAENFVPPGGEELAAWFRSLPKGSKIRFVLPPRDLALLDKES